MNKIRESRWRSIAAPIIEQVLKATAGKTEAEIKAALHAAYPFGPREHHPYKMWRREIQCQRLPGKMTRREKNLAVKADAAKGPAVLFGENS